MAAPGVDILTTNPNGAYVVSQGTSMSSPQVAGLVALYLATQPTAPFEQIKQRLISTSDPVAYLKNRVLANGRINAHRMLITKNNLKNF